MMTSPDFGRSIRAMVRALTFVTDSSHIVAVPTIDHGNSLAHTFGLGAMGLHSYLAQQLIEYGSHESIEFTSIYFMLMNYWTLVESNNIARERGITFHNFEKSDYANGSYFDKYVTGEFVPKSDRVKELFKDVFIPKGLYEWKKENKQTTRDLSILRNYAFNKGIKSIYYVRTFTDDGGEVGANQCESCVI